jgi:hypothetical protein
MTSYSLPYNNQQPLGITGSLGDYVVGDVVMSQHVLASLYGGGPGGTSWVPAVDINSIPMVRADMRVSSDVGIVLAEIINGDK